LNVIPISLPPLRDRKEDIPKLTQYFISIFSKKMELEHQPEITKNAMMALEEYHWPGNVRELENVIERILALSEGGSIDRKEVEEALSTEMKDLAKETTSDAETKDDQPLKKVMDEYEMKLIAQALEAHHGNKLRAAEQLGLTRQSLQYKLRKYGLM
jgi:transcriptional regulator with PAS, ATPase and Fis domain